VWPDRHYPAGTPPTSNPTVTISASTRAVFSLRCRWSGAAIRPVSIPVSRVRAGRSRTPPCLRPPGTPTASSAGRRHPGPRHRQETDYQDRQENVGRNRRVPPSTARSPRPGMVARLCPGEVRPDAVSVRRWGSWVGGAVSDDQGEFRGVPGAFAGPAGLVQFRDRIEDQLGRRVGDAVANRSRCPFRAGVCPGRAGAAPRRHAVSHRVPGSRCRRRHCPTSVSPA
jgi:hypothetical protein